MNNNKTILTLNGGSSSIKFTVCNAENFQGEFPRRQMTGEIERIGLPGASLRAVDEGGQLIDQIPIKAAGHQEATGALIDWLERRVSTARIIGIGHRIVHGGLHLFEHQLITDELIAELRRTQPLDLAHLPREIALIEAFGRRLSSVQQVACFDTAFHRDLPRMARLLPIPRRYDEAGIRRFGFHGLSYSYLMEELQRIAGPDAANGRIILAHLGSGASMAAVRGGRPIDTTMAFTPTAGLVMGTRPGDIDPGLLIYLMRAEKLSAEQMDEFITRQCGLKGIAETTFDMRDLIAARQSDVRAAEAVDYFCYQAKKWIGAYAAVMGGLDTVVFSGGIGEHSPEVRAGICEGLEFLGLHLDPAKNGNADKVISTDESRVAVRVMTTDEESQIAKMVGQIICPALRKK